MLALAQCDWRPIGVEQSAEAPLELPALEPVSTSFRIVGAGGPSHLLPPQDGTDPGEQFPEAERLDNVIIRAEFEANDSIDLVGAMAGRDDDRNVRMRPDFPQHIQPVILAESQIQNDQAGNGSGKMTIELGPV